jgi:hypothetical protein
MLAITNTKFPINIFDKGFIMRVQAGTGTQQKYAIEIESILREEKTYNLNYYPINNKEEGFHTN